MSEPRAFMHLPEGELTCSTSTTSISTDRTKQISGTPAALVIRLKQFFDGALFQCITTTSLVCKVYVSYDQGVTFEPAVSVDSAGTMTAANSTITPSAGDTIAFNTFGATHVRISNTSGTGTLSFTAWGGAPPVATVLGMGTLVGTVTGTAYQALSDESLASVATSTAIFTNAPAATKQIWLTLRTAGITLTRDGSAATAGANGHDFAADPSTPYVYTMDQTAALLVRAIQNGGTATGHITYMG